MPEQIRKLRAIVFTDIAGFTELSAQDETAAVELIDKQRELLKPIVEEFGGEWLKEIGDGLLLSFPSSLKAVNCGIEIQRTTKDIENLNLRISIHQGDIIQMGTDILGDDVNIASRIEPLAAVGGIAISHKIHQDISGSPEFSTKYVGQPKLKGVKQDVKVYCIVSHGLPETKMSEVSAKLEKRPISLAKWAIPTITVVAVGLYFVLTASKAIDSIAVLPFDNLTHDLEQEFFVEGIHEALITELSKIRALTVLSRTSAMHYKGADKMVPEIARELDVDALVVGSVLREGEQVRITVQLIHGSSDRHLWAQSFERELSDILRLHREVARAIAEEIQITLAPEERERLSGESRSLNPKAYEAYLKGRFYFSRFGMEHHLTALSSYKEAIAHDPSFAKAYAAMAEVGSLLLLGEATSIADCRLWARKAVELDDKLAEAHTALGVVRMLEWDWMRSEAEFHKAIELNPNSVMAHQWYSQLLRTNMRYETALLEIKRAEELDPLNLFIKTMVGWPLFSQHRYEEAIDQWDEVLKMDPDYGLAIYNQGLSYWIMGRPQEVLDRARQAASRMGKDAINIRVLTAAGHALSGEDERALEILTGVEEHYGIDQPGFIAAVYLTLGREEEALSWLERGYRTGSPGLPNITSEPFFDDLRDHPRFQKLRVKIGLK
ncbi:MAG: adenylate/guanylate cyclase domain-containing protein [Candidatus Neomarinimicrobiota bacterium]